AGFGLLARAWRPSWWPAALTGAGFLAVHAGLHLLEPNLKDLGLVVVPAALAVWAALPGEPGLHALTKAVLRYGERRYDYDTAYLQAMLDQSPAAFWKFALVGLPSMHRSAAPV